MKTAEANPPPEAERAESWVQSALAASDGAGLRAFARNGPVDLLPQSLLRRAFVHTPFRTDLARNSRMDSAARLQLAEWLRGKLGEGQHALLAADLVECFDDAGHPLPPKPTVQMLRVALSRPRTFSTGRRRRLAQASLRFRRHLTPRHLQLIYELLGRNRDWALQLVEHAGAGERGALLDDITNDWKDDPEILGHVASQRATLGHPRLCRRLLMTGYPEVYAGFAACAKPEECRVLYDSWQIRSDSNKAMGFLEAIPDEAWAEFDHLDLLPFLKDHDPEIRLRAQRLVGRLRQSD